MLYFHTEKKRKTCAKCGRPMASSRPEPFCENCSDEMLYKEVKAYIQANDVTEMELADHFDIPLDKVRMWIREGYIEYRPGSDHNLE